MRDVKTSKAGAAKGKKGAAIACPICGKPADAVLAPFCSKRCADVDLHRWFSGRYAVPVTRTRKKTSAATKATTRRNKSAAAPCRCYADETTFWARARSGQRQTEPL
jgi:endogenous inhibitor of DNA gyrase (YacG/DUF329 family)